MTNVQSFKSREAAVAYLAQVGIDRREMPKLIAESKVGKKTTFEVDLEYLAEFKAELEQLKTEAAKPTRTREVKRCCSTVARALILEGKSNAEVWAEIQAEFGLSDDKKHYPAWYRSELRRKGMLHTA